MTISRRERRSLAVGAAAVLISLAAVYVVEPAIASQFRVREELRQRTIELERHRRIAAEKSRYERTARELRAQFQEVEALRFEGDRVPPVAAEIQGVLHRVGQETGITIMRENVLPPRKVEMLSQVTVELSIRGEMRAIRDFLHRVQGAPRLLTVPKLTLRGATSRAQPYLVADLQVAGFMLAAEERAAPGQAGSAQREEESAWP